MGKQIKTKCEYMFNSLFLAFRYYVAYMHEDYSYHCLSSEQDCPLSWANIGYNIIKQSLFFVVACLNNLGCPTPNKPFLKEQVLLII